MSDTIAHNQHQPGTIIRAWDHEPREGVPDRYCEGEIIESYFTGTLDFPFPLYVIRVSKDTTFPRRPRSDVLVPMQVSQDYAARIEVVEL
jgi:hypothetical protein